jgi:rubrerythrin
MRKMTKANLEAAFAGESQAHMKYAAFAEKARQEGFPNVGRLFQAISYAEQVHATNHLRVLDGVGKTADNLDAAIGGETFEVEEMYAAYKVVAEAQEEKGALRSINYAVEAEKIHAVMYSDAKKSVLAGKDASIGVVHVCDVCGYTGFGEAPDACPVCKAKKDKFSLFK